MGSFGFTHIHFLRLFNGAFFFVYKCKILSIWNMFGISSPTLDPTTMKQLLFKLDICILIQNRRVDWKILIDGGHILLTVSTMQYPHHRPFTTVPPLSSQATPSHTKNTTSYRRRPHLSSSPQSPIKAHRIPCLVSPASVSSPPSPARPLIFTLIPGMQLQHGRNASSKMSSLSVATSKTAEANDGVFMEGIVE